MIKVDVISGFLGAGKTTFIKKLCKVHAANGERVVVIENEFGEVGIDGKALALDGLTVYEMENGCICCTLKADFIQTLCRVADEVEPDRILVEPSGIFVLDDVKGIFLDPDVARRLALHCVIAIVDSVRFLRQRRRYGPFFESQIGLCDRVVLSKTQQATPGEVMQAVEQILLIDPAADIVSEDWDALDDAALRALTDQNTPQHADRQARRKRVRVQRHRGFSTCACAPQGVFDEQEVEGILEALHSGEYGRVLRAKGFLSAAQGGIAFDYVDGQWQVRSVAQIDRPVVSFIGESLQKEKLRALFDAQ